MTKEEYLVLLNKIVDGTATDKEIASYNASVNAFQNNAENKDMSEQDIVELEEQSLAYFYQHVNNPAVRKIKLRTRIAVAASILFIICIGAYFVMHKGRTPEQIAYNKTEDISPGANKAILTLANGQKITLDDKKNGQIARQGQILIQKRLTGK
jgi:transmembrane sensor